MLIHKLQHAMPIIMKTLAALTIAVLLMPLTTAEATEKISSSANKHKRILKKNPHGIVRTARIKKTKVHPKRHNQTKKSATRLDTTSLILSKNIGITPTATTFRQPPISQPAKETKPSPGETDPPLQIGKILYQRNGEIHLSESGGHGAKDH
ncbi:MAG: hypothetical protein WC073_09395 [Sterolibacterium sp.]